MTESATAVPKADRSTEPAPAQDRALPVVLLPREQEEAAAAHDPVVAEVMRPAWVGQPRVRSHRPFFTEHPTQGMVRLPRSRAGIATVVVTRRAGPVELGVRNAPSRWSLFWGRGSLYEIDLGLHHTTFDIELPSAVDLFSFRGSVALEWRVLDPVRVVKDHVSDIREALAPSLVSLLTLDTRHYRVDDVYEAERAVAAALHNTDIGIDYGLTTTIRVQLSADAGAAEHAASRRELQQQIEIEDLRHTQRLRLEATDKDVLRARIELYREIISAGDVEQFALQLARNPDGVETVIRMVREVRKEEHRHVTDFLTTLLESGAIDRWEVKNTVQTALDWLKESNDRFVQAGEVHIPWQRATSYGERNGGGKGSPRGNGTTLTKG
jgi:hypothetical protein